MDTQVDRSKVTVLNEAHGEKFSIYQADCVEFTRQLPDDCIDFSVYSPPFANLFVYSDCENDMGNVADDEEFAKQYTFLVREKFRITKPGRLSAVHCMDMKACKWIHGEIGLRDFPGDIIRVHEAEGWIYHSRITIWKDPVVEMQRTKALGLLWKQIRKDSAKCRVGVPDYILVFRKPGENADPVNHSAKEFPVDQWQRWASPVWMDINQTNVLSKDGAREEKDEKHVCPLQLDVIERCVKLWSNEGDIVFSPFMGIGSEGYQSLQFKRKFIGTELKESYFKQASAYLRRAESESATLFD